MPENKAESKPLPVCTVLHMNNSGCGNGFIIDNDKIKVGAEVAAHHNGTEIGTAEISQMGPLKEYGDYVRRAVAITLVN